jgi:hypothetical protein
LWRAIGGEHDSHGLFKPIKGGVSGMAGKVNLGMGWLEY